MREILFRGKRIGNSEWVYGDYQLYSLQHLIIKRGKQEKYEVIPKTVGLYTGLKDKNGTKIFEWDIVRLIDENNNIEWKAVVMFGNPYCEYSWGWDLVYIGKKPQVNTDILLWVEIEEYGISCEVIGNIHDNIELLKE